MESYKPFKFSDELIADTIQIFKEENNLDITPETASEYLHSFARLFLAYAGYRRTKDGWEDSKTIK